MKSDDRLHGCFAEPTIYWDIERSDERTGSNVVLLRLKKCQAMPSFYYGFFTIYPVDTVMHHMLKKLV